VLLAVLNSGLFFWFFIAFSDCRNVNLREIVRFPIDLLSMKAELQTTLSQLAHTLLQDLKRNSVFQERVDKRAGTMRIESFQPRLSKPIIDEIDRVLAKHYGFTDEELDFILNYDIKYRMGRDAGEGEEA